jgi:hypothetical protein
LFTAIIRDRMPRFDQSYPFRFPGMAIADHNQTAFQPRPQLSFQRGCHGTRGLPGPDADDARKSTEVGLPRAHPETVVPDPDGTPDRCFGIRGIQACQQ